MSRLMFTPRFLFCLISVLLSMNALVHSQDKQLLVSTDYNLGLLANRQVSSGQAKDIWGWTNASDGKEYVLLCVGSGLEIYDISVPTNPALVSTVPALGFDLKDVKTYLHYAYAAEQGGPIQVIDLQYLPDSAMTVGSFSAPDIPGSHNILIDTTLGFAYLGMNGAGQRNIHILGLSDPVNPVQTGSLNQFTEFCPSGLSDTHDMWCEGDTCYYASFGDGILIVDITDKFNPSFIGIHRYPGNFTHSLWISDDHKYVFTTDEIPNGHMRVFDVTNKKQIHQVGFYSAGPSTIIHNVFVRDTLLFISYYGEGVKVLNITDPTMPVEVASYDTYPQGSGSAFNGCWGVYPYFGSGVIAASDINNGLFLLSLTEVNHGWLEGIVRDENSQPVPGARVSIENTAYETYSAADGSYRVPAPNRTEFITVFRSGYDVFFSPVVMAQATTTIFNPVMTSQVGAAVSGVVTVTGADGATVVDTSVRVGVSAHFIGATPPASDGSYVLGNLRFGTERVTGYGWGYIPFDTTIEVGTRARTLNLNLQEGYSDNFEYDQGWQTGEQSATTGAWERARPFGTFFLGSMIQPDSDHGSGGDQLCWLTGASDPGTAPTTNDVSAGSTSLFSPILKLRRYGDPHVTYWRWFSNDRGFGNGGDPWVSAVSNDSGQTWVTLENTTTPSAVWTQMDFRLRDFLPITDKMMFKFIASDDCVTNMVEAALDDFAIYDAGSSCCLLAGDATDDGVFNLVDITFMINRLFSGGPNGACPDQLDSNGDGTFNLVDVTYAIDRVFRGGPAPVCP